MRIARFAAGDEVAYGLVGTARPSGSAAGGTVVAELGGHPFGGRENIRLTGTTYQLDEIRLLAPVLPSKVICFGLPGPGGDEGPVLYLKPSTAVCGPDDVVRYPAGLTQRLEAGGALAVVIGRLCRQVPPDQADAVIFGYTCALNVTARDLAERDGQWARAAGFDTFCPLGPWIETEAGTGRAVITTVNGAVRQRGQLSGDVSALVAYASAVMTLLPGDVLLTGLPAGNGAPGEAEPPGVAGALGVAGAGVAGALGGDGVGLGPPGAVLEPGDEVSVAIDGIGALANSVDKGD